MPGPGETRTGPARPRVLALPSATAWRGVLLLVALLSAGLFAGNAVHHETGVGARWASRVSFCLNQDSSGSTQDLSRLVSSGGAFIRCTAAVNTTFVWFQLAGAVAAVACGLLLVGLAPAWIVRTRGLRPAGPRLAGCTAAVARLAFDGGLRRMPRLYVGTGQQRDAFTFGRPGHYAVALAPALAVQSGNPALFDPVIRHEVAHLTRRDVLLGWSARVVRWVLAPMLLVPAVMMIANRDNTVLPAYLWRATLLALSGILIAAGLLRSREFEADLGSARSAEQRAALAAVLGSRAVAARPPDWRQRLLGLHPTAAARVRVLAEPWRAAEVSGWDGFAVALLTALTAPLVTALMSDSPALYRWSVVGGPATAGVLFGITLGLATWRDAQARAAAGQPAAWSGPLTAGVLAGYALGQTASLAEVGNPGLAGFPSSWSVLFTPLAAMAAAMAALAVAAVLTDAAAALPRPVLVGCALFLSSAVAAAFLWIAGVLQVAADAGWPVVRLSLVTLFGTWPEALLAGAVALLLLVLLTAGRRPAVPGWFVDGPPGPPGPAWAYGGVVRPAAPQHWLPAATAAVALAAGTGGGAVLVVFGLVHAPPDTPAARVQGFDTWTWVFALSAAAAVAALAARYGRRGLAAGLAAAPLASCVAAAIKIGDNTARGGRLTYTFISGVIRPGLGLGIALLAAVALLTAAAGMIRRPEPAPALIPAVWRGSGPPRRQTGRLTATAALAFAACALLAAVAVAGRGTLSPLADQQFVNGGSGSRTSPASQPATGSAQTYQHTFAPTMAKAVTILTQAWLSLESDPRLSGPERAAEITNQLVPTARELLDDALPWNQAVAEIRTVNAYLTQGLIRTIIGYQDEALGYQTGSAAGRALGQLRLSQAAAQLSHWAQAVTALS